MKKMLSRLPDDPRLPSFSPKREVGERGKNMREKGKGR